MNPDRRKFSTRTGRGLATLAMALGSIFNSNPAFADYQTSDVDEQKVYYGIENERCNELRVINYNKLLNSTSESEKAKGVESGTAEYWNLLKSASDKVIKKWIPDYAESNSIDQIVESSEVDSFEVLPEKYKESDLSNILKYIDVTDEIISLYGDR